MKFDCDQCGTRYNIADEKVRRKVLKIRCRVCEHVITVRGADLERSADDDAAPKTDGEAAQAGDGWFAAPDGEELGPMSLERLQGMVEVGDVAPDTLVWCEGMPDWIAVGAVPELVSHLPRTSSLDDEATSTFELHDRIDDSLRRTLLSTPPPREVRAEPSEPDRRDGIGWEAPDERPTVAEPSIGPLVPGAGGVGGATSQRRILVVLIVLAVVVLLALVGVIAWWVAQPPGQRPGLGLAPAESPPPAAAPASPAPAAAPAAPAAQPAAPASGAVPAAGGPPPETLTQAQVEAVIAGHKDSIDACRGEHEGALPARKDVLAFDLRPTGRVSNPELKGPLAATEFAKCLTKTARTWRFPVFTGGPIPVQYPFELAAK